MRRWSLGQLLIVLLASVALWAVLAAACLAVGSTGWRFPDPSNPERMEPVIIASIVGAALAAAGVVYQAILRNPLAEPYLLGVSSGAALAVYVWTLPLAVGTVLDQVSQQSSAFVGALVALVIVFMLAQRRGRLQPVTLLLVGVIVNAINGAIYLLLYYINLRRNLSSSPGEAFGFLVGGIKSYLLVEQIASAGVVVLVGWIVLLYLSGQLNVAMVSEAEAEALGVRIQRLRWIGLVVASLVTAAAMSISGPIAFIGLVCPHIARLVVGNDQRRLLPVATALGAGLLALADAGTRVLGSVPQVGQVPVGVITGFLGGPFFLYLLWRSNR